MLEEIGGSNRQGKGRRGADFLENTKCHSEDCSNHKTRSFASGDVYVGEWAEGKMHGQGKTTWADGDVYVGEYAEGKKHGRGKYTWTSGNVYEGEWSNDKQHGQGTKTYTNGRRESGTYRDGTFVG